jgi:exonuclease III
MRIITWNTDCKTGPNIYDYVFSRLRPDVALLQEVNDVILSASSNHGYNSHWKAIGGTRLWGSAIAVLKEFRSEPLPLAIDEGWIIGAKVITPKNTTINVISLHARLKDDNEKPQCVVPHLRNIFEAISPFMTDGQNIIIGEDFNADRFYDKIYDQPPNTKHGPFFDYLEKDLGLINACKGQTFFGDKAKHKYQDDYIFINPELGKKLKTSNIPERETVMEFSDHSPIIVSLHD